MRVVTYARVSTDDQSLNLQLDALHAACCDRIFEDRISGKARSRPGLDAALATARAGDQIVVWRLDRLGRTFAHLVDIAEDIRSRGINLLSLTEGIDTSSSVGEVIYRLMIVFADFERKVIVERTIAGLAAARARGVRLGKKPKMSLAQAVEARRLMDSGMRADEVASRYQISRTSLFRHLRALSGTTQNRAIADADALAEGVTIQPRNPPVG